MVSADMVRACDLDTAAADLRALAESGSQAVRQAVAWNVNTPAPTLEKLAEDGPDVHGWVRVQVAANPSTPASTLRQLATGREQAVRAAVAANPSTPAETLLELAADWWVRTQVAANPSTPEELLRRLANQQCLSFVQRSRPDLAVRAAVAANPSTPHLVLLRLLDEAKAEFAEAAADTARRRTTAKSMDPTDDYLRGRRVAREVAARGFLTGLAANPNAPSRALADLAGHPDPAVRQAAAAEQDRRRRAANRPPILRGSATHLQRRGRLVLTSDHLTFEGAGAVVRVPLDRVATVVREGGRLRPLLTVAVGEATYPFRVRRPRRWRRAVDDARGARMRAVRTFRQLGKPAPHDEEDGPAYWMTGTYDPERFYSYSRSERDLMRSLGLDADTYDSNWPA